MIVPSMNYGEVYNELINDFRSVKVKTVAASRALQQLLVRKKQTHCSQLICYRTARNNTWHIYLNVKPQSVHYVFYITTRDAWSSVTYQIAFDQANNVNYLVKLYKHFFERYNERLFLGLSKHEQVVKHYITHNVDNEIGLSQVLPTGQRLVEFVYGNGIGIGWEDKEKKFICLKTFIANSTLTKTQKCLADHIRSHDDSKEFFTFVNPKHLRDRVRS